jgi:hypothetical protein
MTIRFVILLNSTIGDQKLSRLEIQLETGELQRWRVTGLSTEADEMFQKGEEERSMIQMT